MKTIKKQFKPIVLLLAFVMLFQGCTVYKSSSVSLDEAAKSEAKVIVKENNSKAIMFDRIELVDGKYFGVKKFKGDMIKMSLDENNLNRVSLKNKALSTIISIAIPLGLIGGLIVSWASQLELNDFNIGSN